MAKIIKGLGHDRVVCHQYDTPDCQVNLTARFTQTGAGLILPLSSKFLCIWYDGCFLR